MMDLSPGRQKGEEFSALEKKPSTQDVLNTSIHPVVSSPPKGRCEPLKASAPAANQRGRPPFGKRLLLKGVVLLAQASSPFIRRLPSIARFVDNTWPGSLYVRLREKLRIDTLGSGGVALITSTAALALIDPYITNKTGVAVKLGLAAFAGVVSSASYWLALIGQRMTFHDRECFVNAKGEIKREGLYACWSRYATTFLINEPPYQTLRLGILIYFLVGTPVLPPWFSNVLTTGLGLFAALFVLPKLLRWTEKYQKPLEGYFLKQLSEVDPEIKHKS